MKGTNDGEGKECPLNQFQEKARRLRERTGLIIIN